MSVDQTVLDGPPRSRWFTVSRQNLEIGLLWFTMSISGFVLFEPAPFEFMVLILVGFWLVSGLHIPRSQRPLVFLLGTLTATGLVAALLSTTLVGSARHIAISIFLYILTIGLAAYIARDPKKSLPVVMNGYTVAAILATVAAILGYFQLVGGIGDLFVSHGRARGTLKDPNVFGPFIAVPMLYIFVQNLTGEKRLGDVTTAIMLLLGLGILLSFSRGAWVNLIFACVIATYLIFVSARSNSVRLKVMGLTICIAALAVFLVIISLNVDAVAELMSVRGKLLQSYDTGERFVGARIALDVIFTNPLGIGAKSFKNFHNLEPHNVYLYSFLIGGWLGGFAYIGLVLSTIYVGLKASLRRSPIRTFAIVLFSAFLATAFEGLIIDSDHWRHFYILIACIWGIHEYLRREDQTSQLSPQLDDTPPPAVTSGIEPKKRAAMIFRPRTRKAVTNGLTVASSPVLDRKPTFNSGPTKDRTPTPNTVLRKAWRRKLGKIKLQQAVSTTPRTPNHSPPTDRPNTLESAEIMTRPTPPHTLDIPTERSQFGLRKIEDASVRDTFGMRRGKKT